MKHGMLSVFRHACIMVSKHLKSYAYLSVTIILSFAFLLGYLLFIDSESYNDYKELFQKRREDVVLFDNTQEGNTVKDALLRAKLDAMDGTQYFLAYSGRFGHMDIYYANKTSGNEEDTSIYFANVYALFLQDYAWLDLIEKATYNISNQIAWIDGRASQEFVLEVDEVILSEKVYRALKMEQEENPVYQLRTRDGLNISLRVVGYTYSNVPIDYSNESWFFTPTMLLSTKLLDWLAKEGFDPYEKEIVSTSWYYIYSEMPEVIVSLGKTMEYGVYSVYEEQDSARVQMQTQKKTKSIIACALLVLLGINLYSSFSNAMNERKYEIGVKRAVGASAWSIVRQFLYESLLVMLANVAISIALVVDVGVLYKIFMEWQSDFLDTYVLYLTPHSMVIFGACAVTLTVVFSLIFAYKSTQVEIVQYLKAE